MCKYILIYVYIYIHLYRYVVVNLTSNEVVGREQGAARILYPPERSQQQQEGAARDFASIVSVRDEATTDRWPEETRQVLEKKKIAHLYSLDSQYLAVLSHHKCPQIFC